MRSAVLRRAPNVEAEVKLADAAAFRAAHEVGRQVLGGTKVMDANDDGRGAHDFLRVNCTALRNAATAGTAIQARNAGQ